MRLGSALLVVIVVFCFAALMTPDQHQIAQAEPQAPAQVCGDVDGNGFINMIDPLSLHGYLFNNAAAPAGLADADLDLFTGVNIRDEVWLVDYVFYGGPAPSCPPVSPENVCSVATSDTLLFPPDPVPSLASSAVATVTYKNTTTMKGLALPLQVRVGDSIPTIDSVTWGSRFSAFNMKNATVNADTGTINVGVSYGNLAAGSGPMLNVYMSFTPVGASRVIVFDTLRLSPDNYPMFVQTSLQGIVPEMVNLGGPSGPTVIPHDLEIVLYSPVDMVVTDPLGDSIGINDGVTIFNTILNGSTYDTLTDYNLDLDNDDIVNIPSPFEGDYNVRIIAEPGASGDDKFTMSIRINGNQLLLPDDYQDATISSLGVTIPDTYTYTTAQTLPGDCNADGTTTAADIIYLVNYVFKGDDPPVVPGHGDVNCDGTVTAADVIGLVSYVFKGGNPPCSQTSG